MFGTIFGILLIIILLVILLWPYIGRWVAPVVERWMIRRFEDQMRRMAGMPTRKEESKMRKEAKKRAGNRRQTSEGEWDAFRDRRSSYERGAAKGRSHEPIIPKEYAEDVEFVEIKSYSEETVVSVDKAPEGDEHIMIESQVEDAEYVEIKK